MNLCIGQVQLSLAVVQVVVLEHVLDMVGVTEQVDRLKAPMPQTHYISMLTQKSPMHFSGSRTKPGKMRRKSWPVGPEAVFGVHRMALRFTRSSRCVSFGFLNGADTLSFPSSRGLFYLPTAYGWNWLTQILALKNGPGQPIPLRSFSSEFQLEKE
jgi:hypothetical protein